MYAYRHYILFEVDYRRVRRS
ncbi:hypothetical protein CBM2592_A280109 [Cupriavidus taiwanensis]|nr:hypothetical protein CBM2592_A280109 [Cupriavidus taiwanensis]SPA15639.1 hypothetical protein CBM2631_A320012 [Cupriavidus taiwanensis]